MARHAQEIIATRGKKVIRLNLAIDKPDDETIAALIVGPSGNLRAPALRIGKKLLVGFDEETYRALLLG